VINKTKILVYAKNNKQIEPVFSFNYDIFIFNTMCGVEYQRKFVIIYIILNFVILTWCLTYVLLFITWSHLIH